MFKTGLQRRFAVYSNCVKYCMETSFTVLVAAS